MMYQQAPHHQSYIPQGRDAGTLHHHVTGVTVGSQTMQTAGVPLQKDQSLSDIKHMHAVNKSYFDTIKNPIDYNKKLDEHMSQD